MTDADTQSISRDLRLDRIVTWVLCTLVGILVMVGRGTMADLKTEIGGLREAVSELKTSAAISERAQAKIEEHEERIRQLEIALGSRD